MGTVGNSTSRTCAPATERRGAASDRAGVWGGAPRIIRRARARPRRSGAGQRGPRKRPSRGVRRSPTYHTARTCAPATERRGAAGPPQATEPGCGAEPHVSYGAHVRARDGAARGSGAPASDRAGVWGGAPRIIRRARARPRRSGAGQRGPRKRPSRGVGRSPTYHTARTCAPATERRGAAGPPQATEPGVWGGSHVSYGAHVRARDGAARGSGAPASDRAGVWGGAPRKIRSGSRCCSLP